MLCLLVVLSAAKNGVVIATDKKVSSELVDSDDYQKIQAITPSTGKRMKKEEGGVRGRATSSPFQSYCECHLVLSSRSCKISSENLTRCG